MLRFNYMVSAHISKWFVQLIGIEVTQLSGESGVFGRDSSAQTPPSFSNCAIPEELMGHEEKLKTRQAIDSDQDFCYDIDIMVSLP